MAEFSFDNITAEKTELPKRAGGRTRKVQSNPFLSMVQESYNDGMGRKITIPNEHYKDAEYLIRQAAADLGLGVRIVASLTKEEREAAPKNKKVDVQFQGQKKRNYTPRNKSAENGGGNAAE